MSLRLSSILSETNCRDKGGMAEEADKVADTAREGSEKEGPTSSVEHMDEVFRRIFQEKHGWSPDAVERIRRTYLEDLSEDLPDAPRNLDESVERSYSDEEIEQLSREDPGFLNEKAMKPLDRLDPDDAYIQLGLHFGTTNYGKDAVDGSVEKCAFLPRGKMLERRGDEGGRYLSDPGMRFEDLQLAFIEERYPLLRYRVEKPFLVEESLIESQPFDERQEKRREEARTQSGGTKQYKAHCSVAELVEKGYLKRIENEEEMSMRHGRLESTENDQEKEQLEDEEMEDLDDQEKEDLDDDKEDLDDDKEDLDDDKEDLDDDKEDLDDEKENPDDKKEGEDSDDSVEDKNTENKEKNGEPDSGNEKQSMAERIKNRFNALFDKVDKK